MRAAGEAAGVDFILGGNVNVFEFIVYEWNTEVARSMVLEIQLVRVRDGSSCWTLPRPPPIVSTKRWSAMRAMPITS